MNVYQGKQHASTQLDCNQFKCTGEMLRIDNIDVSNGISNEECECLIQETILITDGETNRDVNNNRTLDCLSNATITY